MGVHGFYGFLSTKAPECVRQGKAMKNYTGYTIAVDASMSLYAFLVAIRDQQSNMVLTNESGDDTSHISGMLSRSLRMLEAGINPIYVFDGKPPEAKAAECASRREMKQNAEKELKEAQEKGDAERVAKLTKRTVRVTEQHNKDVQHLFNLMGISILQAPSEAEAQCASLVKEDHAWGVATEDADALCFGATRLVRYLSASESKQKQFPPCTLHLPQILEAFEYTMEQFVDFCILCGCDYTKNIRGIGPATAYTLIQKYKTIEAVVENLDPAKYKLPDSFPFEIARKEFRTPEVLKGADVPSLKPGTPDYVELRRWLIDDQSFNEKRVDSYIERLKKFRKGGSQTRLDSFFGPLKVTARAKPKGKAKKGKNTKLTSFKK